MPAPLRAILRIVTAVVVVVACSSSACDHAQKTAMNLGTIYLLAAAALLFGAGFFAARRVFPQLQSKQVGLIALIAFVTVGLIWGFSTSPAEAGDDALVAGYSAAAASTKSGSAVGTSTGAG